ncbi:unnamed protein product [Blepharisma stoltei]|uniref:PH domain-containing protein n=1 Tax=Blepharisma stoltei TaxID=1481888 RepID=A0AAU9KJ31_9CILI|nr:unnamed protein product [Blepharisma stoltei]
MENLSHSILSDEPSKSILSHSSSQSVFSCPSSSQFSFSSISTQSSSQLNPTNLIQKSGWLQKKSTKLFRRWHWRFFLLKDKKLVYFRKKTDKKPSATINFDQVTVNVHFISWKSKSEFLILPLGSKSGFKLKTMPQDELFSWASAIIQHIEVSDGNKFLLTTKDHSWRSIRVSEKQFLENVSSGDVLLFQSKCVPATLQRTLIRSNYDHVAMLLNIEGTIMFLEATRLQGVSILEWESFKERNWHLLYNKLVYRKIEPELNLQEIEALENFIAEVQGKKFRFTFTKRKKFSKGRVHVQEKYFCSELVASAYQMIGILPCDVLPSYFWPKHFSSDKVLPLVRHSLSQEMMIDFEIQ